MNGQNMDSKTDKVPYTYKETEGRCCSCGQCADYDGGKSNVRISTWTTKYQVPLLYHSFMNTRDFKVETAKSSRYVLPLDKQKG